MNQAVAYMRVSTEGQARDGVSLDAQQATIQAWAKANKIEIKSAHTDAGISGSKGADKRPGLLDALASLRSGDVLVVAKRCRLGRDTFLMATIGRLVDKKGARIASVAGEGTEGDDPSSVLMRNILDAFNEHERRMIGSRTKAALAQIRAEGRKTGGTVPYGYRVGADGRTLTQHPGEQRAIALLKQLKETGVSLRAIARRLIEMGIPTKTGGTWTAVQVGAILRREVA